MITKKFTQKPYCMLTLLFCAITSSAHAIQWGSTITIDSEHTNNSLRTSDNQRSDLESTATLNFDLLAESSSLQANLDYEISRLEFQQSTQEDQTEITGTGNITWSIIPQSFQWDFSSQINSLRSDLRQVDIADNREERRIYSTGPDLILNLSPVDQLIISSRFTKTDFETTNNSDNDRLGSGIQWQHRLSPTQNLGAGFQYTQVSFDDTTQEDITTRYSYLSYESQLRYTQLQLRGGYNESERRGFDSVEGPVIEASTNYSRNGHEISLRAIHQLTDSTIGLQSGNLPVAGNNQIEDSNFDTIDIVERTFGQLSYNNLSICTGCSMGIALAYDDQDFENQPRDEQSLLMNATAGYRASSKLRITAGFAMEELKFLNDGERQDTIKTSTLRFDITPPGNFVYSIFTEYRDQSSDDPLIEFTEWRGGAAISYQIR